MVDVVKFVVCWVGAIAEDGIAGSGLERIVVLNSDTNAPNAVGQHSIIDLGK